MLTAQEVAAAVADLAPRVEGGQIQKAWQPDPETLVLRVRRPGASVFVVLSCAPTAARIGESPSKPAGGPPQPPALCAWVRSAAGGRRVTVLRQLDRDRVVELAFEGGRIVAELSGRHANLFGIDEDGVIAVSARPSTSRRRDLRPGRPYVPPVTPPPADDSPARFERAAAIEAAARARLEMEARDAERARRDRLLRGVRRRLERLRAKVADDVARSERADEHRRRGELLKTQAHGIPRGSTEVRVTDWFAEGTPTVTVPLDPTLDGPGNVERYFALYRKARSGLDRARRRLDEVDARLAALARIEERAEADDAPAVAVEAALREAGLWRPPPAPRPRGAAPAPRRPYREYVSRAGERILVGRGGADNHETTFHVARGNDHWLHVRDAPGAHVIVPRPARDRDPHPETLLDAAALAVHHSDLRGEPAADVTVTQRKHVRAVRGAPPGRVTIAGASTLTVPDVDARVRRLLGGDAPP